MVTWRTSVIILVTLGICWAYVSNEQDKKAGDDEGRVSGTSFLGYDETEGFPRVSAPRKFRFPRDHGPHPRYKLEWWYFTGNLDTATKRHFGFELTFFRIALTPKPSHRESRWGTNQVYMAHFALSDIEGNRFHNFERFSRGAAGLAGTSTKPFRVWLDNWFVAGTAGQSDLNLNLHAVEEDIAIDLNVRNVKPVVLQGDRGYSQKSAEPGNASYYYSLTRLSTEGVIRLGNQAFTVKGLSWMDREWSTSSLGKDQVGWDWFALQLSDGHDLMFYLLRRRGGTADPLSSGTLVLPDGTTKRLQLEDVEIKVRDHWRSRRTGGEYPSRWWFRVPRAGWDLHIQPYMSDQELDVSTPYWEGAVSISGTNDGIPITGSGYVELVGYGSQQSNQRRSNIWR